MPGTIALDVSPFIADIVDWRVKWHFLPLVSRPLDRFKVIKRHGRGHSLQVLRSRAADRSEHFRLRVPCVHR